MVFQALSIVVLATNLASNLAVDLGDGDDSLTMIENSFISAQLLGGNGNDRLKIRKNSGQIDFFDFALAWLNPAGLPCGSLGFWLTPVAVDERSAAYRGAEDRIGSALRRFMAKFPTPRIKHAMTKETTVANSLEGLVQEVGSSRTRGRRIQSRTIVSIVSAQRFQLRNL